MKNITTNVVRWVIIMKYFLQHICIFNAVLLDPFLEQNSMQSIPSEFHMKMRSIELTGTALIDRLTVPVPLITRVNSLFCLNIDSTVAFS